MGSFVITLKTDKMREAIFDILNKESLYSIKKDPFIWWLNNHDFTPSNGFLFKIYAHLYNAWCFPFIFINYKVQAFALRSIDFILEEKI